MAIANQYFPEIGLDIINLLQNEFNQLQEGDEQNDLINYDVKIRNVRFLGELTKFGLETNMLDNLKRCLNDFHGQNIEIVCNLLETCGRYLINTLEKEPLQKLNECLDLMKRLKEKEKISSRQLSNIEQAYHMCRPILKKH